MILGLTLAQAQPPAKKADSKKPETKKVVSKKAAPKKTRREHTGAELYEMNCNRCHSERYPMEHSDARWTTIMMHMRTRAQIPAADAEKILEYLKDSN